MKPAQAFDRFAYEAAFPVVASGCDWLEYTAPLELGRDVVERLGALQDGAKRGHPEVLVLGENARGAPAGASGALFFEPLPKSARFYRWGLQNDELGVTLWFTDNPNVPGCKVELRSHVLWHYGAAAAYQLSKQWVAEFVGCAPGFDARPARVDFCVDFQGVAFDEWTPLEMVTRARKPVPHSQTYGICVACEAPFLHADAALCALCGAPRATVAELERAPVGGPGSKPWGRGCPKGGVPTVVSTHRSVNPHVRGLKLAGGALPKHAHGGMRRPFTGWTFGNANPIKLRLYDKSREIDTNSPDKVWMYEQWNAARRVTADGEEVPAYTHQRCPGCGHVEHAAKIVAADAPRERTEQPAKPKRLTAHERAIWREHWSALGIEPGQDGPHLARLVRRMCSECGYAMEEVPVWRCEVVARGNLLTKFSPTGKPEDKIRTVDEVIEHADEIWRYLVGAAYRHCQKCGAVPIGKHQRRRYCVACVEALRLERARPLTAEQIAAIEAYAKKSGRPATVELRRARLRQAPKLASEELAAFRLNRRNGWVEARDPTEAPNARPTRWPVQPWWHHLQSIAFAFSSPPTYASRRLRAVANAELNTVQATGCTTSAAVNRQAVEKFIEQHGRAPTKREFIAILVEQTLGHYKVEELYATYAIKADLLGRSIPPLSPDTGARPDAIDWRDLVNEDEWAHVTKQEEDECDETTRFSEGWSIAGSSSLLNLSSPTDGKAQRVNRPAPGTTSESPWVDTVRPKTSPASSESASLALRKSWTGLETPMPTAPVPPSSDSVDPAPARVYREVTFDLDDGPGGAPSPRSGYAPQTGPKVPF